jgi:hypothetical protein
VFLWPSINALIARIGVQGVLDFRSVFQIVTPWLAGLVMVKHTMPLSRDLNISSPMVDYWSDDGSFCKATFLFLTTAEAMEYADTYFDTFGVLHLILDRDVFMTEVVARVLHESYKDGDASSVSIYAPLVHAKRYPRLSQLFAVQRSPLPFNLEISLV